MMNKTLLHSAIVSIIGATSLTCQAALVDGTVLAFDTGIRTCAIGGTYPDCVYGVANVTSGSYFSLDSNADGDITYDEETTISMHDGITIGAAQSASGAHGGAPDGTESPGISKPWLYFCNTGLFYTASPITVVSDNGYSKTLDFSGWRAMWNFNDNTWNLGGSTQNGSNHGSSLATITCSTLSCAIGSTFVLDYAAVIPNSDDLTVRHHAFTLHMEGQIAAAVSTVPIPASAWLFTSGLISLLSIARRKHQKSSTYLL